MAPREELGTRWNGLSLKILHYGRVRQENKGLHSTF